MSKTHKNRVLYIIVCGAGPASEVSKLVDLAQEGQWQVQVIATSAGLDFIDALGLEAQTGRPVRTNYRELGEPRSPRADAIIVAPATYNTINKWAVGVSDTYPLGILAEAPGLEIPTVVLPFVNSALAERRAFRRSIEELTDEGVRILLGPDGFEPHAPGTGEKRIDAFPWLMALNEAERMSAESRV